MLPRTESQGAIVHGNEGDFEEFVAKCTPGRIAIEKAAAWQAYGQKKLRGTVACSRAVSELTISTKL